MSERTPQQAIQELMDYDPKKHIILYRTASKYVLSNIHTQLEVKNRSICYLLDNDAGVEI